MKVRWTEESVRLRITPRELDALRRGETVGTSLAFPGGCRWTVRVDPRHGGMALSSGDDALVVELSPDDVERLAEPDREGVYRAGDPRSPRLLVEKDFPCAHPHAEEAAEPETPRFAPTDAWLARRAMATADGPTGRDAAA